VLDPVAVGRIVSRPRQLSIPGLAVGLAALLLVAAVTAVLFIHPGSVQPKQPSIAIMPFANLSIDPKEAYFTDGITEDLITDLVKLSAVDVIARNCTFKYQDQNATPKDTGDDLGVNFIVESSVRCTGDQIRISAQLINAASGNLLWVDKYDRKVVDIFAIQVTAQRLDPNLSATDRPVVGLVFPMNGNATDAIKTLEQARADSPGVNDIHVLLAAAYLKADRMAEARTSTAEALRLDPALCIDIQRLNFLYFRDGDAREALLDALQRAGLPSWPHGFQGNERDRLSGEDISQIVLGTRCREWSIRALRPSCNLAGTAN
jgi:adenylate cyclase